VPFSTNKTRLPSVDLVLENTSNTIATIDSLMEGRNTPNYKRCVEIATEASLGERVAPGVLVTLLLQWVRFGWFVTWRLSF
jgi:Na+/H+-translocating membrane pyrophosphatase